MFDRILLPLDGSELAELALPYGEELATRLGSEIALLHVCSPDQRQSQRMCQMYLDGMADIVRRRMRKGRSKGREVEVKSEILVGEPIETICGYVDKNHIGLVVMAASGASGPKLGMLGSVVDKVARMVNIPSMLIRTVEARRGVRRRLINRILLPLDGSDAGELTLPVVEELAGKLKARVTLFQMAQMIYSYLTPLASEGAEGIDYARLDVASRKGALTYLVGVEKKLRQKGITVIHSVVSGTDPAHSIIEMGKKVNADLVVMSSHGRSPIGRWVFGSATEKVLRHGDIPLLLVGRATS